MNFSELTKKRFSVRKYSEKEIEEDKLLAILEAGRLSPTAHNNQPQRLIVVKEKENLAKISKATNIFGAPLAIIVCADHDSAWVRTYDGKNTAAIDASIVTTQMMYQATDLDLGTLWICRFDPEIIIKEFNIPSNYEPINILAIGYRSDELTGIPEKNRKPMENTVFYETL